MPKIIGNISTKLWYVFFLGSWFFENVFSLELARPLIPPPPSLQSFPLSWSSSICVAGIGFRPYWLSKGWGNGLNITTKERTAWPSLLIFVPCFDGCSFSGTSWDSPSLSPRCSTSSIPPCWPSGQRWTFIMTFQFVSHMICLRFFPIEFRKISLA